MKSWTLLAQKMFITDKKPILDGDTRELIVELFDYILKQDDIIDRLEAKISEAQITLQEPIRVRRS